MKKLSVQNEIANLENELNMFAALGTAAYLSKEAKAMKERLFELKMSETINPFL